MAPSQKLSARPTNPLNSLLRDLPPTEARALAARFELVQLSLHDEIYAARVDIAAVYFPETAMISLVTQMQDGTTVEMGVVGRFGMAGLPVLLGARAASSDAFVQIKGTAQKMSLVDFRAVVTPSTRLYARLLTYTQSFLVQSGQAAACNALHTLRQRCARWLLTVADQIGTDSFQLTHEFLAQMLGVRRAGITAAHGNLKAKGLITSSRGNVAIRDRGGLEKAACECFGIIHRELYQVID